MNTISYSAARGNFAKVMEQVCDDYNPVTITRQKAKSVVMMSLDEYDSLMETLYLLRSPKNAARLLESIAEIEAGKAKKEKVNYKEESVIKYSPDGVELSSNNRLCHIAAKDEAVAAHK